MESFTNWSSDEDIDKNLYNLWGNVACRTIKKELKALEIIKNKDVECWYLVRCEDLEEYNDYKLKKSGTYFTLTQEEYDFLIEVLEDE